MPRRKPTLDEHPGKHEPESNEKALFLDTDTMEIIVSDGLRLLPPSGEPITGDILDRLDLDEEDNSAYTGFGNLVPALGYNKWDGHVYVSGATGAGKSYLINDMLMHDKRQRKVFLFTDHKKIDPSLKPMIQSGRMKIVREDPDESKPWEVSRGEFVRDKRGNIMMFDDCTDPDALFMRDNALRKARHQDTVVICVNHKMRDNSLTKHILTNSRYMVSFPASNRGDVNNYMRSWLELHPRTRRALLRQAQKDGRQIIFHLQCPNVIATAKSIFQM